MQPAQEDKVRQIAKRATIHSGNMESHTGVYVVEATTRAGVVREYRIYADGTSESRATDEQ